MFFLFYYIHTGQKKSVSSLTQERKMTVVSAAASLQLVQLYPAVNHKLAQPRKKIVMGRYYTHH